MGYGKRGTGRSYDSYTGHASVFGYRSKKLIGFDTKMRKCFRCDIGHSDETHNCAGVYEGTAKSMESSAAVDLMSDKNTSFAEANVRLDVFIGDGDNSGISQVRANSDHPIDKWLDINHAAKSFNNFLFKLKPKHKYDNSTIDYLNKNFRYALAQNRGDPAATKASIINVVDHSFGSHTNCGAWCGFTKDPSSYVHKSLPGGKNLTGDELRKDLKALVERFAENAASLAPGGSSQANESFNNTVSNKSPKNRFFGGTFSHNYRVSAVAAQTNIRTQYISNVYTEMTLSPGQETEKQRKRKDYWRLRVLQLKKSIKYKTRRLELKAARRNKRLRQNRMKHMKL